MAVSVAKNVDAVALEVLKPLAEREQIGAVPAQKNAQPVHSVTSGARDGRARSMTTPVSAQMHSMPMPRQNALGGVWLKLPENLTRLKGHLRETDHVTETDPQ